jgi:hypothetical protein
MAFAAAAALALGSCTETQGPCPYVRVLPSVSQITKFAPNGPQTPENMVYQSRIANVAMQCTYSEAKYAGTVRGPSGVDSMEVLLKVKFGSMRGPKAAPGNTVDTTFFVAVADLREVILDRQEFKVKLQVGQPNQIVMTDEEAWMYFKLQGGSGAAYRIYTGFQLSTTEADFNRSRLQN